MTPQHHSINYIEMPSSDLEVTKKFYSELFGWTFTDWGPEYVSFEGAGIDGGFRADGDVTSQPPGVLVVLYSNDLETSLASVTKTGVKITKPIFSFPGGRRFQFQDPSGNELAIWTTEET